MDRKAIISLTLIILVFGAAVAGYKLYRVAGHKWYRNAVGADVGDSCTAAHGCVQGADCMVSYGGILPPFGKTNGICIKSCTDDAECLSPKGCLKGYCVEAAESGEPCGGFRMCANGECLSDVCRERCTAPGVDMRCPDGTSCTAINTGARANPLIDHYCLPASP